MPRDDSHCREPAARRACRNPSTTAGVKSCPPSPRSTNHRLRCAISCSWPAAELGVYPRSANTVRKPSAYGANGPLTRTRIALFIIDSSPDVVVEEKSRHERV